MTAFWSVAALLLGGALLMLVPPLWRAPLPAAGGSTALARGGAWLLLLGLPLASVTTYLKLGDQRSLAAAHAASPTRTAPADAEGWVTLGRSYVALGRFRDAATAWRRAADLRPEDAGVLADLADVLAMAQGKRLAGEPSRFVQRALDADPRHFKALALAGSVAFEARDYAAARGYWDRLLALAPAESELARAMRVNIAQAARLEAALAGVAPTGATAAATTPALSVEVQLAASLRERALPGDTLFVVVRPAQGERMPLAATRQLVGDWPARLAFSDASSLQAARPLSSAPQVIVVARVSRSGQATPQPGDLVGESAPVASSAQGLPLLIDRVQP